MKVYCFYLNNDLYAFTTYERFAEEFKSIRKNVALIIRKMNKYEFKAFSYINRDLKLIEIPLIDEDMDYSIIGTIKEENELSTEIDNIHEQLSYYQKEIRNFEFLTDEVRELLLIASNSILTVEDEENGTKDFISEINSFKIFIELFKKTF